MRENVPGGVKIYCQYGIFELLTWLRHSPSLRIAYEIDHDARLKELGCPICAEISGIARMHCLCSTNQFMLEAIGFAGYSPNMFAIVN